MKKIMKMGLILSVLICLGSFVGCNSLNKKQVEATENKEAVEAKDTTDEKLVFNRIVSLKSSYKLPTTQAQTKDKSTLWEMEENNGFIIGT